MGDVNRNCGQSEVYIILRVFGMCSDHLNMRVYVDPEELRVDENLVFTGETWPVVPR